MTSEFDEVPCDLCNKTFDYNTTLLWDGKRVCMECFKKLERTKNFNERWNL